MSKLLVSLLLAASAFACASQPQVAPRRPIAIQPADDLAMRKPDQIAERDTRDLGKLKPVPGAARMLDERGVPEPVSHE